MVGERVNSQGSRKAKEMLLADDYDGINQIAVAKRGALRVQPLRQLAGRPRKTTERAAEHRGTQPARTQLLPNRRRAAEDLGVDRRG